MPEKHDRGMKWKVHVPHLLNEVLHNPTCSALEKPLQITGHVLAEVAERAIALNDPILNELMMDLTLYEQGDPGHPEHGAYIASVRKRAAAYRKRHNIRA